MIVTFGVPFVMGKQRPRFFRRKGKTCTYTPKETKAAMGKVKVAYEGACLRKFGRVPKAPKGTPVTVAIVTMRALPRRGNHAEGPERQNVLDLLQARHVQPVPASQASKERTIDGPRKD